MIALTSALPLQWVFPGRSFGYNVRETVKYARSETTRIGRVTVAIKGTTRGWTDIEATTNWDDARRNRETVWLRQKQATGELFCIWFKGTERSHTFNPSLRVWNGQDSETLNLTPTYRPFGHQTLVEGRSKAFDAPSMPVARDTQGIVFKGETAWKGGDGYAPVDYRLTGEFHAPLGTSTEPGFDCSRVLALWRINSGRAILTEKTGPNETKVSETIWATDV